MNKESRQRKIIELMKEVKKGLPFTYFSEQFDKDQRTIRRDFDDLINNKNAPWFIYQGSVFIDQSRNNSVELHGYWFDKQEIEALFVLNQVVEQLSPGSLKSQLKPFEARIKKLLENEVNGSNLGNQIKIIEIADRKVEPAIFQMVVQSLNEQKQISIEFLNREFDQITSRIVSPIQLVRYKDNWKLDAWCHTKKALRTFSLEAIQSIQITSLASQKIDPEQLKYHHETSYGIFAGKADKIATINFSPYIARWVKYEQWHPDQAAKWDKEGYYQLKIPYCRDEELLQDILKYAGHAEIIAPIELREKAKLKLKQALENYA